MWTETDIQWSVRNLFHRWLYPSLSLGFTKRYQDQIYCICIYICDMKLPLNPWPAYFETSWRKLESLFWLSSCWFGTPLPSKVIKWMLTSSQRLNCSRTWIRINLKTLLSLQYQWRHNPCMLVKSVYILCIDRDCLELRWSNSNIFQFSEIYGLTGADKFWLPFREYKNHIEKQNLNSLISQLLDFCRLNTMLCKNFDLSELTK